MSDEERDDLKSGGEVRLEIGAFRYARAGLELRQAHSFRLEQKNRITLLRPKRAAAVRGAVPGFPENSAFPLPGTLALFWLFAPPSAAFAHRGDDDGAPAGRYYQVFGHSSAEGSEAHGKHLSERRAKVGSSLLRSDVEALKKVAAEERWGAVQYQAMLRMLACDPGPIDGILGVRSQTALARFQERFNKGVFHRRVPSRKPEGDLEVDGLWTAGAEEAIIEAFVVAHGANMGVEEQHPSHPVNGCAEYNLSASTVASHSRRISLIAHDELPAHHDGAPCRVGDETACAVLGEHRYRCIWFRHHVEEPDPSPAQLFDPRWLWLGERRYLLSVLTTVGEDGEVEFDVYDTPEREGGTNAGAEDWVRFRVGTTLRASPRLGVAHVIWDAGSDVVDADGRPFMEGFPVFRARHVGSGAEIFGPWPEKRAVRILVGAAVSHGRVAEEYSFRLMSADGAYDQVVSLKEAKRSSPHKVVLQFDQVPVDAKVCLSWGVAGGFGVDLLVDVDVQEIADSCGEGPMCNDVPPASAPLLAPDVIEEDEHMDAVNAVLAGAVDGGGENDGA